MKPANSWMIRFSPLVACLVILCFIPPEKTLGNLIRLIYFHGAWIWSAILLCTIAGVYGLLAILFRKPRFHKNSSAFGWIGLIFLLLYLPMALLVMKLSWGGLFLSEPRWSIPFSITLADLLVQVGVYFIKIPTVSSLANLGIGTILVYNISKIQSVLHPEAPIQASGSISNQVYFYLLLVCLLIFGILLSRLLFNRPVTGEKHASVD
jgi:hypothetical protein